MRSHNAKHVGKAIKQNSGLRGTVVCCVPATSAPGPASLQGAWPLVPLFTAYRASEVPDRCLITPVCAATCYCDARLAGMAHPLPQEHTFSIQPTLSYALHLRLTPQLLDALASDHDSASIKFGDAPGDNVRPCLWQLMRGRALQPAGPAAAPPYHSWSAARLPACRPP